MAEKINTKKMDEEMNDDERAPEEEFEMSDDEKAEAKVGSFNPFWSTKEMESDKAYKFRIMSDKLMVREVQDKFEDKKTKRIVLAVEELESGVVYDIAAAKEPSKTGKYSSLTLALRRLYALTDGNIKGRMISFVKRMYIHEKFGETAGYTISLVELDD